MVSFSVEKSSSFKSNIYFSQTYNKDKVRRILSFSCVLQQNVFSLLQFHMNYS